MLTMHERLRQSTRQLHDDVEQAVDFPSRLGSLDSYVELLDRLWSLHAGFERELQRHDFTGFALDLAARQRSQWLAEDIVSLAERRPLNAPVTVHFDNAASALGGLYVLEGSTLGGQILLKQLVSVMPVSGLHGARFFTGHGDRTGAMWKNFLGSLDRIMPDSPTAALVERGAIQSFEIVQHTLASASAR